MYYNAIVNCVHAFREKFKRGASKRIGDRYEYSRDYESWGSKISANVNFEDLKAFADYLIQKTKEEVEESILAKKKRLS